MKVDYRQLNYLHPMLKTIIADLENTFDVEFRNTSNYRPGDEGVHGYGRGWDIGCSYEPLAMVIKDYIDATWVYDPARPIYSCCVYHDTGSGYHIHLQVHDNTRAR